MAFFNKNLTQWHYAYDWNKEVLTGNGHYGDWTIASRKATFEDAHHPKEACTKIMDYARVNSDNRGFRDRSGIKIVHETKFMTVPY
jgi:hypothetical protein